MKGPVPFIHPAIEPAALARLAQALELWQARGATLVHLPWTAPARFVQATRPPHAGQDVDTPHGQLLASGEQAFCWLASAGALPPTGTFVGLTPCFRDEPVFDAHHHYGFLKAEVFAWAHPDADPVHQAQVLAARAAAVMGKLAPGASPTVVPLPGGTFDLELAGLEVGSVGARAMTSPASPRPYLYATALAEPRFSQALARLAPPAAHVP